MNLIDDIKVLASSGFALSTWWIEALDPVLKCLISVFTLIYVSMRIRYLYKNKGE
tara:strand:+ start:1046 stop:1210 length:165 start_codon:yes stop_codon:yes gene_type:complete